MTSIAATNTLTGAATQPPGPGSESLVSSDFDTWMTLLTAQLRNQDPFDPVDSTAYTAQLAQFSAVEQQVRTNDLLGSLVSATASSDMASMAEWIGKEVRIAVPASYQGPPVTVFTRTSPIAQRADLVVRDSSGAEVDRFAIDPGEKEIEWSGTKSTGGTLPWGLYSFEVESYGFDDALLETVTAEVFALVREVRRSGDQFSLVLPGGTSADTADISAVRTPRV